MAEEAYLEHLTKRAEENKLRKIQLEGQQQQISIELESIQEEELRNAKIIRTIRYERLKKHGIIKLKQNAPVMYHMVSKFL